MCLIHKSGLIAWMVNEIISFLVTYAIFLTENKGANIVDNSSTFLMLNILP